MKRILIFLLCLLLLPSTAVAELEAHFLDVGHGDCTMIICDGEAMIIDGGVAGRSQQVHSYIKRLGITTIKYAVASHPDADHIGGLPAAFHAADVEILLTPVAEHDEKRFQTLIETAQEHSTQVVVPKAGGILSLGGAMIEILSPVIMFADTNDMSLVLRIDYGSTSLLFTGDASSAVERDLIARNARIDADVLKVSHHGSSTGTTQAFVRAVSPEYAVISCAEASSAPSREALYALADTRTLITAQKGTIVIKSDGRKLTIASGAPAADQEQTASYIGNSNSKVYHDTRCQSVEDMKEKNRVAFLTADQAEAAGYRPCKNCCPK